MTIWVEYFIVFIIVAVSAHYVWTKILFKKSKGCSGCNKCAK